MHDDEKMDRYIARMKTIIRELKNVGENVPDARWTNQLVSGLPRKYAIIKANMRHRDRMTEAECITVLLEEESVLANEKREHNNHRRQTFRDKWSTSPTNELPSIRDRADFQKSSMGNNGGNIQRCHACGGSNHLVRDCYHVDPEKRPPHIPPPRPRQLYGQYSQPIFGRQVYSNNNINNNYQRPNTNPYVHLQ